MVAVWSFSRKNSALRSVFSSRRPPFGPSRCFLSAACTVRIPAHSTPRWLPGLRDGSGGLLGEGSGDHAQTLVKTLIGQLGASEFVAGPVGGLRWWGTKGGRIWFKHPTIEYISGCGTMR